MVDSERRKTSAISTTSKPLKNLCSTTFASCASFAASRSNARPVRAIEVGFADSDGHSILKRQIAVNTAASDAMFGFGVINQNSPYHRRGNRVKVIAS